MTHNTFKCTPKARRKSHSLRTWSSGGVHAQSVNTAIMLASVWFLLQVRCGTDKGRHKVLPKGFSTGGTGKALGPQSSDTDLVTSSRGGRLRVLVGRIEDTTPR